MAHEVSNADMTLSLRPPMVYSRTHLNPNPMEALCPKPPGSVSGDSQNCDPNTENPIERSRPPTFALGLAHSVDVLLDVVLQHVPHSLHLQGTCRVLTALIPSTSPPHPQARGAGSGVNVRGHRAA